MKSIKLLTLAALAVTLLFQAPMAQAGDHGQKGGKDRGDAKNTFTKWIVGFPDPSSGVIADMEGVVGGDVGDGTFTGEVLSMSSVGDVTMIRAVYHFHGSKHSFTAEVDVVQTGLNGVVIGVVTDGWLKGKAVKGEFLQSDCDEGLTGACYQGTLQTERNPKD